MTLQKRLLSILMACSMVLAPATALAASEQVDFDRTGSVTVSIRDHEKDREVAGGSLVIYKLALLKSDEQQLYYEFDESFADFEYDFSDSELVHPESSQGENEGIAVSTDLDIENSDLVKAFLSYIDEKKPEEKKELDIDENGFAKADNLKLGLYLILQDKAAEGYKPINSFLLAIPMDDGETLIYDIDASPKVETTPDESEPSTEPSTEPTTPSGNNPPGRPPHLPQTGQLWWPVPILAFAGLLFFTIGWKKRYKQQ